MTRGITRVTVRYEVPDGKYYYNSYEVGKKSKIPGAEVEMVLGIQVSDSFMGHVEVIFENFGEYWIIQNINEIYIENERYREIINVRKATKEAEDTKRKPKSLSENIREIS